MALIAGATVIGAAALIGRNLGSPALTTTPAQGSDTSVERSSSSVVRAAPARQRAALPGDLATLGDGDFVAAMPELERRARGGDVEAQRLLFERLNRCASYHDDGEAAIRARIDEDLARQKAMIEQSPSLAFVQPAPTEFTRQDLVSFALAERQLCVALTTGQTSQRFEWARLALLAQDRRMIIDLGGLGVLSVGGVERVRYVETLRELSTIEVAQLDRLVEAGDLQALSRAAFGYSMESPMLLPADPFQAYVHAYAYRLIEANPGASMMDRVLQSAQLRLSPEQLDAAQREGLALKQRCCAQASISTQG